MKVSEVQESRLNTIFILVRQVIGYCDWLAKSCYIRESSDRSRNAPDFSAECSKKARTYWY